MIDLKVHIGDCREVLKNYPNNHFDSCVTDPPYEIGFMNKKWDSTGITYDVEMWEEVLRVLKPGAHILVMSGTRTYHRMTCAVEDVGFEIRDMIEWLYGSGFPKSHDISKAIDKMYGVERGVVGKGYGTSLNYKDKINKEHGYRPKDYYEVKDGEFNITTPSTLEAKQWKGWGTALKPAHEPIVLARKQLEKGLTVTQNVIKYGCGGLNIDGGRIFTLEDRSRPPRTPNEIYGAGKGTDITSSENHPQGRYPANLILDEEAGRLLDEQSGKSKSSPVGFKGVGWKHSGNTKDEMTELIYQNVPNDSGGASRFFYCPKASKTERRGSKHPTIKPLALIEYLVRLITPPGGKVLDPFLGSGTTLEACKKLNMNGVGIEIEEDNLSDILNRLGYFSKQKGLGDYAGIRDVNINVYPKEALNNIKKPERRKNDRTLKTTVMPMKGNKNLSDFIR